MYVRRSAKYGNKRDAGLETCGRGVSCLLVLKQAYFGIQRGKNEHQGRVVEIVGPTGMYAYKGERERESFGTNCSPARRHAQTTLQKPTKLRVAAVAVTHAVCVIRSNEGPRAREPDTDCITAGRDGEESTTGCVTTTSVFAQWSRSSDYPNTPLMLMV